jgi:hypothetical protein
MNVRLIVTVVIGQLLFGAACVLLMYALQDVKAIVLSLLL